MNIDMDMDSDVTVSKLGGPSKVKGAEVDIRQA